MPSKKSKSGNRAAVGSSPPERRLGRAWAAGQPAHMRRFIATSSGLYPIGVLEGFGIQKAESPRDAKTRVTKESKQLIAEQQYMSANELIAYPVDTRALLQLRDNCTYLDACIRQIAKDVTGHGWSLDMDEKAITAPAGEGGGPGKVDEAERKRLETQAVAIRDFLGNPNAELTETILDIVEKMVMDWGGIGWMCMEASRGGEGGAVDGLWHVPAQQVKMHKDKKKFCQVVGMKKMWFKAWGADGDVDQATGRLSAGKGEDAANELVYYRNYYSLSNYYGAPNCLPATGAVLTTIGIRDYNLSFFENYGVPAALVEVQGDWEEDSVKLLSDFIDTEIKGSGQAHKTVVLNPPEGGSVKWVPLVTEIKEGHFKLYSKTVRDEILVAYRMPPYRIGIAETGSLGQNVASESTRIYVESIVTPLQQVVEALVDNTVVRSFGVERGLTFRLGRLDMRNFAEAVTTVKDLFGMGLVTRAQACGRLEIEPPPEDDPDRDRYFIAQGFVPIEEASGAAAAAGKHDAEIEELERDVGKALAAHRNKRPEGEEKET